MSEVRSSFAADPRATAPAARQRKTLALLLDYMGFISGSYETDVRDAFDRACREQDLNLLLFFGGAVDDSTPSVAARNSIFELARSSEVDAIAACSTVLATRSGADSVASCSSVTRTSRCAAWASPSRTCPASWSTTRAAWPRSWST